MLQWIDHINPVFPSPTEAIKELDGLLCAGGNLTISTLLSAYRQGIFPWFNEGQPILWWSPDPRMVLFPDQIHISSSMKKWLRKTTYQVTWNKCFDQVICACASSRDEGTWINHDMKQAYLDLHKAGYAQSIEIWDNNTLIGGLYGPLIGKVFFGESMFSRASNASKMALIHLARSPYLQMIDCQFHTLHLQSMGAKLISREKYLTTLQHLLT